MRKIELSNIPKRWNLKKTFERRQNTLNCIKFSILNLFLSGIISVTISSQALSNDKTTNPKPSNLSYLENPWIRNSQNPIIKGNGNTILQQADPSVIYDNNRFQIWFSSVGKDNGYATIGYSESFDGFTWSSPIIVFKPSTKGSWDDQTTEIPSVIKDDTESNPEKRCKMWYGESNRRHPNLTKIGFAFSSDGKNWTRLSKSESPYKKEGLVMIPENKNPGDYAVVAEPSVIKKDGKFKMWYSAWDGDALVISYATSFDGIYWIKYSNNPVLRYTKEYWEANGLGLEGTVAQPTVLWDARISRYRMWYGAFDKSQNQTYAGIGYAESRDGKTWQKKANPVFNPSTSSPGEEIGISTGPSVILVDKMLHLYYS